MTQHSNLKGNIRVVWDSGIVTALPHMPIQIQVGHSAKKQETLQIGMIIRVGTDLQGVVVTLEQVEIIPLEKREGEEKSATDPLAAM